MIQNQTIMNEISVKYTLIWQHKKHPHYQFTKCKKCFNVQRGKQVKMVLNGGSIGFWIAGKFETLTSLRPKLIKIIYDQLPF